MAETVIKNMKKEGATDEEIARALGWSAAGVRNLKDQRGIKPTAISYCALCLSSASVFG